MPHCTVCCLRLKACALPRCCSHLANNSLQGGLPPSWSSQGSLPALSILDLQGNRLNGSLDGWGSASAFPALVDLRLSNNSLSGGLGWQCVVHLHWRPQLAGRALTPADCLSVPSRHPANQLGTAWRLCLACLPVPGREPAHGHDTTQLGRCRRVPAARHTVRKCRPAPPARLSWMLQLRPQAAY